MAEGGVKWKEDAVVPVGSHSSNQVQISFDIAPHIPVWMQETLGMMRGKKRVIRGFGESSFNYILATTGFIVSSRLNFENEVGKALRTKCMFMLGCLPVASYKTNLTCSDTSI